MAIRVRAGLGQPQNPSFFSYKTISESLLSISDIVLEKERSVFLPGGSPEQTAPYLSV